MRCSAVGYGSLLTGLCDPPVTKPGTLSTFLFGGLVNDYVLFVLARSFIRLSPLLSLKKHSNRYITITYLNQSLTGSELERLES